METRKRDSVFPQYIDQYLPVINRTLTALRADKDNLHIPYAQFLFSVIDYFGLLYTVASTGRYNKRDPQNFIKFLQSGYFQAGDRCKASLLWFIRNGLIHQIFSKASGVGTSTEHKLFFPDLANGGNATLNLNYLDGELMRAIDNFVEELKINDLLINNLHDMLIEKNYGLGDHAELEAEIQKSFGGDSDKIFSICG